MKIANGSARTQVQARIPFKGNNTFGEMLNGAYAVFSYGRHWPLFAYIDGTWFENQDRYGRTTSKHHGQLHPLEETEKVTKDELLELLSLTRS
jgi:hypothetical protein